MSRADISKNALSVLRRLDHSGYAAYLVGGSVRDLLLRHSPKDFDVATDATPEQVQQLFRNCRLIGRRFRLAHIFFGRDIVEVATFRAGEGEHSEKDRRHHQGLLLKDNVYGTLEEDAWRRDFTVNALYYNIKDFSIIDFTGGFEDIKSKTLRIIGDPSRRFLEDPARIIRAIRFAAKLNFTLEPATESSMLERLDDLKHLSPARLFEEILKLFHGGYAVNAYRLLKKYNLMTHLFEQTSAVIDSQVEQFINATLENTDQRIHEEKPITPAFLFAALLWFPLQKQLKHLENEGLNPLQALEVAMSDLLNKQRHQIAIPRRITQIIREIWIMQYRLPRRFGKRPFVILRNPRFRAAYDFLVLRAKVNDADPALAEWWTQFQTKDEEGQLAMLRQFQKQQQVVGKKNRKKGK